MVTNTRDPIGFLEKIKKALMIPADETFADDEIRLHIDSCMALLESAGVPSTVVQSTDALVEGLILIYVKTYFGFKNDGGVRELPSNFDMLLRQLTLTVRGNT